MSVSKSKTILKTALLAPGGTLLAWGVQQALQGDITVGGVGAAIGLFLVGSFVAIQEHDVPYEDEIVSMIDSYMDGSSSDAVSEELKDASGNLADRINDADDEAETEE